MKNIIWQITEKTTDLYNDFIRQYATGFHVLPVNTENQFHRSFKQIIPDLIVLDFETQRKTQWQYYIRLKTNDQYRHLPVLFTHTTLNRRDKTIGDFLSDGIIDCSIDPSSFKELMTQLINDKKAK